MHETRSPNAQIGRSTPPPILRYKPTTGKSSSSSAATPVVSEPRESRDSVKMATSLSLSQTATASSTAVPTAYTSSPPTTSINWVLLDELRRMLAPVSDSLKWHRHYHRSCWIVYFCAPWTPDTLQPLERQSKRSPSRAANSNSRQKTGKRKKCTEKVVLSTISKRVSQCCQNPQRCC